MFRFYKIILNLKTRLQEQNLKKILIFFHYHLNLFICCKTKLKIKFMFTECVCFKEWFFLQRDFFNRIKFFERGCKCFFWINNFIWKKKRFLENHTYFFLKNFFFNLVLLHLNNHSAFHFVEIFHLVEIFAINEWKLKRLILNRLKYQVANCEIKRSNCVITLYWNIFHMQHS